MSSITKEMLEKLEAVGFSMEWYKPYANGPGSVFYADNERYTIGGRWDGTPLSEKDQEIAAKGIWLPRIHELLMWFDYNEISFKIEFSAENRYFYGTAVDKNGTTFNGSGPDFEVCLYKLIFKILKNGRKAVK